MQPLSQEDHQTRSGRCCLPQVNVLPKMLIISPKPASKKNSGVVAGFFLAGNDLFCPRRA